MPKMYMILFNSEDDVTFTQARIKLGITKTHFDSVYQEMIKLLQIKWLAEKDPVLLVEKMGQKTIQKLAQKYLNKQSFNVLKDNLEYETNKRLFESQESNLNKFVKPRTDKLLPEFLSLDSHYEILEETIPFCATESVTYVIVGDDNIEHEITGNYFSNKDIKTHNEIGGNYEE